MGLCQVWGDVLAKYHFEEEEEKEEEGGGGEEVVAVEVAEPRQLFVHF